VNAMVGLLASGGSTNHTIHLVAVAKAAGYTINWDDFDRLSSVTPLLARIYPNGDADVNHFHAAGGVGLLVRNLLAAELVHPEILTAAQQRGLRQYTAEPVLRDNVLVWEEAPAHTLDPTVISDSRQPFSSTGGINLIQGNLGRGIIKV